MVCASPLGVTPAPDRMARPRSAENASADAAYEQVGQAIESVQQELEQLRQEGATRSGRPRGEQRCSAEPAPSGSSRSERWDRCR
jgi:hypothetical protein